MLPGSMSPVKSINNPSGLGTRSGNPNLTPYYMMVFCPKRGRRSRGFLFGGSRKNELSHVETDIQIRAFGGFKKEPQKQFTHTTCPYHRSCQKPRTDFSTGTSRPFGMLPNDADKNLVGFDTRGTPPSSWRNSTSHLFSKINSIRVTETERFTILSASHSGGAK